MRRPRDLLALCLLLSFVGDLTVWLVLVLAGDSTTAGEDDDRNMPADGAGVLRSMTTHCEAIESVSTCLRRRCCCAPPGPCCSSGAEPLDDDRAKAAGGERLVEEPACVVVTAAELTRWTNVRL